jgi:RNA polymerase sigma-70 factor (ECF subfamily)
MMAMGSTIRELDPRREWVGFEGATFTPWPLLSSGYRIARRLRREGALVTGVDTVNRRERAELVGEWHDRWHSLLDGLLTNRLGDRRDVQDLAQEVYLRLLRVDKLDLIQNPKAYLYRVAVNIVSEWRLRARQKKPHSPEGLDDLVTPEDHERTIERKEVDEAVRQELSQLPPMWRKVLVLHCSEEMTYEQIAEHLGITRRMVKRYMAKGYAEMRKRMSQTVASREEQSNVARG